MNKSKQREAVLSVLRSTTSHPTAEWIYENTRLLMPNVSLGTVYRNLDNLLKVGEIIKVQGAFDKDRYDGNPKRHAHLVCDMCGAVLDIEIDCEIDNKVMSMDSECLVKNYNLIYNGLCPSCK